MLYTEKHLYHRSIESLNQLRPIRSDSRSRSQHDHHVLHHAQLDTLPSTGHHLQPDPSKQVQNSLLDLTYGEMLLFADQHIFLIDF